MVLDSGIESFLKGNHLEDKMCKTCKDDCKHTEVDHYIEVPSKEKQSKSKDIQRSEPRLFLFRHRFTSRWPWRRLQAPWPIGSMRRSNLQGTCHCPRTPSETSSCPIPKYKDSFPNSDSQRWFLFPRKGRKGWDLSVNAHSPLELKMGSRKRRP